MSACCIWKYAVGEMTECVQGVRNSCQCELPEMIEAKREKSQNLNKSVSPK